MQEVADIMSNLSVARRLRKPMNSLSFEILANPDTNEHQLRILIDGEDILSRDFLGLDPASFFVKRILKRMESYS